MSTQCSKHVREYNKLIIKQEFCALIGQLLRLYWDSRSAKHKKHQNCCISHFDMRATYPPGLIILYMTQNILKAVPRAGFDSGGQCGLHNRDRCLSNFGVETDSLKNDFTETRYKSPVLVSPDRLTHPNFRDQPTYVFREIIPVYCLTYTKETYSMIKTFLILQHVMHSTSNCVSKNCH